jgi:hypothetical protein
VRLASFAIPSPSQRVHCRLFTLPLGPGVPPRLHRPDIGGGFPSTRHEVDLVAVLRDRCSMYLFPSNCGEIPQKLEVYTSVFRGI